jgi:hypothetical protein
VKGLGSLKELASGRRARLSTPGREETVERSSAEYVDEQIAQLLETIEDDARAPQVLRDDPVRERLAPESGPAAPPRLRRRHWRWDALRSVATYILLGAAGGALIATLLVR